MNYPSNSDDVIDSRDVIEAIAELAGMVLPVENTETGTTEINPERTTDLLDQYASLSRLAAECENYSEDWQYGATLIRDSYFEDYAQELATDIGLAPTTNSSTEIPWPYTCIDWARAARELRQDYRPVDFDGVTYWIR